MKVQIEVDLIDAPAVQRFLQNLEVIRRHEAIHKNEVSAANAKGEHYLGDKFLVTGADTLSPCPLIPQPSREDAEERARELINDIGAFTQKSVIVWAPVVLVKEDGSVSNIKG